LEATLASGDVTHEQLVEVATEVLGEQAVTSLEALRIASQTAGRKQRCDRSRASVEGLTDGSIKLNVNGARSRWTIPSE
jgi:hypothetical protein